MERFPGEYPGLEKRLDQIAGLIDEVAREAGRKYPGEGLDLVVLPEEVVTRDKGSTAATEAAKLEGPVHEKLGAKAREYKTYLVVPMVLAEDETKGIYSNSAVLLDRAGNVAGIYRKVHPVAALGTDSLEGGITPGREFPVFGCDFGKLGIQICYDLSYEDGWNVLARKGAEIVAVPTMSPQTSRPAAYAAKGRYYVVTSTPRNNASIFNPVGMIDARITDGRVLVHRVDLSYAILPWSARLRDGKALSEKYGDRVGYTYYPSEDAGVFWSNDPATPIMSMVRELEFREMADEIDRIRNLQDTARGTMPER
jgi:predicted amidohydrolase